ncbi:MAG: DNA-processing protein DprA [Gammaproteobacteria bacterium]
MSAWLRLEQTPGLGPVRAARLLARFGDPLAVFAAPQPELAAVVGPKLAATLAQPPAPALADYIKKVEDWLGQDGHHLLTQDHPGYPALLREIADAPLLLYAKGRVDLLDRAAVAIVGSRNATVQGQTNARAFAHALAGAGLTVVSGMALGIDAAAHEGALDGAGSTVAVVGTGVDRIYPARNQALARRIAGQGCLISEYPLGMEPLSANFPRRNRIISGLCQAVLVVEAAAQSGSLITAHVANEQGRDVFAIPGSIHAPLSKGCHRLIKEGAALVESIDDLLEALHIGARRVPTAAAPADVADEYAPLLDLLAHGPVHADQLANAGNVDPALLAGQLLALELAGQLERLPGGLFQRVYR